MNRTFTIGMIITSFLAGMGVYFLYRQRVNHNGLDAERRFRPVEARIEKALEEKNVIPVAVIGSGPAGLSAALYAARSSLYTVVFEGSQPGGQLTTTSYVENWPGTQKSLGTTLIAQARGQAEQFGARIVSDTIERVNFSSWPFKLWTSEGKEMSALSVIIATGARPLKLEVPGEQEYWGKGVTTCAICDAPYYKDGKVVVIGGGDSAIEEATLLASFAKEVTILVRKDYLRAAPAMQQRLPQYPHIKVVYNTEVKNITGDTKKVTHVELHDSKEDKTYQLPIDGVFLAIGHVPNTQMFKEYIATDDHDYLQLGARTQQTSLEGVFAAGDVSDPEFKQAGTASGDGIKAGLGAVSFLREHDFNDAFAAKLEKNYYDPKADIMLELKEIKTAKEFTDINATNKGLLVLDFYAPWCVSCTHMLPVVSSVAAQLEGKATFMKVNTGESKELAEQFNVPNVPWLLVFKNGKEVGRTNDIMTKRQLFTYVSQYLYASDDQK